MPPTRGPGLGFVLTVGIPAALQAMAIYWLIVANTGNGSSLGLAALLLGIPFLLVCIPINIAWTKRYSDRLGTAVAWGLATAFILPLAILAALWLFGSVITELGLHK